MTINTSLLVAAPMLQDYLVDKDSGAPLSAGIITCYQDDARTVFKNWYKQTGSPGAYTYVALPNPLTLSGVGTIQDGSGNDVIPFFYPYDENDETIVQSYYITVVSFTGVSQFTRENFPFVPPSSSSSADQFLLNYIPNGQFTSHNNLPPVGTTTNQVQNGVQQITTATQGSTVLGNNTSVIVAQGGSTGWYFIKPHSSTDIDKITFTQITQEPSTLTGNPRYAITLSCSSSNGNDAFKELRMRFNNVNRFASDTRNYTFSLSGINNNAGNVNISLNYIKYFGAAGSSPLETQFSTFTLPTSLYQTFNASFSFGSNSAFTIGTANDDYIEISIGLPATSSYNLSLTNVFLTAGNIVLSAYPERTDNQVFSTALAGSCPTPAADGSSFYLPIALTRTGVIFDKSNVGKIHPAIYNSANPGELLCDGTQYLTSGYSSDGIPYTRIQSVFVANGLSGVPQFGTGRQFATAFISSAGTNHLYMFSNMNGTGGTVALPVDHNTGFTFSNICNASNTIYGGNAYRATSISFFIRLASVGLVTSSSPGTTSFTVSNTINNALVISIIDVNNVTPATSMAGQYFYYWYASTQYVVWFTVDGAGSAPSIPGSTLIQVNLKSTDAASDVCNMIVNALNGGYGELILTNAASTLTPSAYFTFGTLSNSYYVWYSINNSSDPAPGGIGIKVVTNTGDSAATVATNTLNAINNMYFGVPDLRGMFLRGQDIPAIWNLQENFSFGYMSTTQIGNALGGYQFDAFQNPTASAVITTGFQDHGTVEATYEVGTGVFANLPVTTVGGSFETRPVNMCVNWYIKI